MILVVCAIEAELKYFTRREGVEILACGVGPVEAALATAAALARTTYRYVLNVGIAGAFRGAGAVGSAVLVGSESMADLGLESGEPLSLPDGNALVERVDGSPELIECCADLGLDVVHGVTVSTITTSDATAARRSARYRASVESMEGFSVLRAGAIAAIPALEVRGISNYVGDRARSAWNFDSGAKAAASALDAVLHQLSRSSR